MSFQVDKVTNFIKSRPNKGKFMKCPSCSEDNKEGSRFCRRCGKPLTEDHGSHRRGKAFGFLKKIKPRHYVVALISIFLFAGVVYGAMKGDDYLRVTAALNRTQQFNEAGDFQDALVTLNAIKGRAVFKSQQNEIAGLSLKETSYIQDENALLSASSSIALGDFTNAQTLLETISTDFPQYAVVKDNLAYVESQIEQGLQTQASQAKADAAAQTEAKITAQTAADAAKAQAAAAAKAKLDAETQAAQAQAAQAAQAQEQIAQIRQTALNSLSSIYITFKNNGLSEYSEGINYYNADDNADSETYFDEAMASFKSTSDSLTQLSNSYTNLDNDIKTNISNFQSGVLDCMQATLSAVKVMGGTSVAATTNYYYNTCISYANSVSNFVYSQ